MGDALSQSEKLAIRGVMENTIRRAIPFNFGKIGDSIVVDLWPRFVEAVIESEHFEDAESACEEFLIRALETAAKKKVSYKDQECVRELMEIVLRVARETYCELRGIPCEADKLDENFGTEGRGLIGAKDNVRYVNFGGQQHPM